MKKIFMMLVILFVIYLGIQVGYSFFGKGHNITYSVTTEEKTFTVKEEYKNDKDNRSYFFEINYNDNVFYYQTLTNFKTSKQIIKNIYYYNDNKYSCIFPIYENNLVISDILCKENNIIYNYHDIVGDDQNLDSYVSSLESKGYTYNNYIDNAKITEKSSLKVYEDNILKDTYYGLANYKGVYLINNSIGGKVKKVDLFDKDVYKRPLSIFFKKYYVVADYNKDYRFDTFYVVDITNSKTKEIKIGKEISFDGYIQGTSDNSIYFFDRTSKTQYEINLKTNKVIEVGNENTGIKVLSNGEWNRVEITDALNGEVIFTDTIGVELNYDKIDKQGAEVGYYYLYKKLNNNYNVYRTNIQNTNQIMYLFNTIDNNRIIYNSDYVYYIDDSCIKYYQDSIGERKLLCYNELNYNNNLIFGVYND